MQILNAVLLPYRPELCIRRIFDVAHNASGQGSVIVRPAARTLISRARLRGLKIATKLGRKRG